MESRLAGGGFTSLSALSLLLHASIVFNGILVSTNHSEFQAVKDRDVSDLHNEGHIICF